MKGAEHACRLAYERYIRILASVWLIVVQSKTPTFLYYSLELMHVKKTVLYCAGGLHFHS